MTTPDVAITGGKGVLGQGVGAVLAADGRRVHVPEGVDLTDLAAAVAWAEALPPLGALVCCAGGYSMQPITSFEAKDFDFLVNVNLRTAANAIRACAPGMASGGAIVLVGAQTWTGVAGAALYAASKAAVVSLSKSAALELKPRGIRVNCVLPDLIDTPANRAAMPGADFDRWQKPEEIGRVIRFLCSDDAAVVTGNAISVSR